MSLLEDARVGRAGERLAPGEALPLAMPERDLGLAELPAEERRLAVHLGREVDQPELDVLQLRARLARSPAPRLLSSSMSARAAGRRAEQRPRW